MALTKAEMAEALFNQLGLNKREAARARRPVLRRSTGRAIQTESRSKLSGFGNFDLRDKNQRSRGETPRQAKKSPSAPVAWSTFPFPAQKLESTGSKPMLEPKNNAQLPAIPGKRYFTIGEVSELCGVKPHVLRYWEQEFPQLKPVKRRRQTGVTYQRQDVIVIRQIRSLLYEQGFTIGGRASEAPVGEEARVGT